MVQENGSLAASEVVAGRWCCCFCCASPTGERKGEQKGDLSEWHMLGLVWRGERYG